MIIILNGVPNSGKTTVSRLLQTNLPNTVHLEVDVLRNMFEWMKIENAIGLAMENALTILPNFVKRQMNVIYDYPLDLYWYEYILKAVRDLGIEHHTFTLMPRLEVAMTNRGGREISSEMAMRIKELYDTDMNHPSIGTFVDNTNLTPQETANLILKSIGRAV